MHIKILCLAGGENSCERNVPPVYFHRAGWKEGDDVPARSVAGNAVVDFLLLVCGREWPARCPKYVGGCRVEMNFGDHG